MTSRRKKIYRIIAAYLAVTILAETAAPTVAMALTSGPSQPEVQSFEPVGTSDMVDLFSGDFNYNIPLFELPGPNGGYPFNLAYHSGIGMDQEASWVGLGWNLNPGAITREMRGIPDDFNGDEIKKKVDMRDMHSFGYGVGMGFELFGADFDKLGQPLPAGWNGNLNIGLQVYYNNYKGVGYSLEPGFSLTHDKKRPGAGFGLSLDSQEGVGVEASLSMGDKGKGDYNSNRYSTGIGFHSKRGLELSASMLSSARDNTANKEKKKRIGGSSASGSSTYSFSERAYTPMAANEVISSNVGLSFKFGIDNAGAMNSVNLSGFYSIQHFHNQNTFVKHKAYGYNNLYYAAHDASDNDPEDKILMDFNREKDGMVHKATPNLAMPQLTYDYYNVMGQGIGGMFRPYRSDIGAIHDPLTKSWGMGGSYAHEFGTGTSVHLGFAGHLNFSTGVARKWEEDNEWDETFPFYSKTTASEADYEDVYYKMRGEPTSYSTSETDDIGGYKPVEAKMVQTGTAVNKKWKPKSNELTNDMGTVITTSKGREGKGRMKRNTSIQPITNTLLLNSNDEEILKEYDIKYYASPGSYSSDPTTELGRTLRGSYTIKENHTAGITAVSPDGSRYVYGLPAYNLEQYEVNYTCAPPSASGNEYGPKVDITSTNAPDDYWTHNATEKYYSRTEIPPYAHAYMLTSVLGTDYVDIDDNGPSEDDYGYWVKFSYVKTSDGFKWRAPFTGANYDYGYLTTEWDDKGSYIYGKKENWHVARAETKTHIAIFHISPRHDAFEAATEINDGVNDSIGTATTYKLDSISLYSRPDFENTTPGHIPTPIKRAVFEYDYSLCKGVENSDLASGDNGKLTLKKVYFIHQNNRRGKTTPYQFDYSGTNSNPNYSAESYDRWGNYKRNGTKAERVLFPYTRQFDQSVTQDATAKTSFKTETDEDASVWNLRTITLPTGGTITINYEADDYAYVQHKKAAQMFNIEKLSYSSQHPGKIYGCQPLDCWDTDAVDNKQHRKVYFKLENPIPSSDLSANGKVFNQYIEGLKQPDGDYQLYYKIKVKLRDDLWEYVSGYANIEKGSSGTEYGATNIQTIDGVSCYTEGYFTLKLPDTDNQSNKYHPFAVAAWQHLRTNQPDLLVAPGTLEADENSTSPSAFAMKVQSLGSVLPALAQMFTGYRYYAFLHEWGSELDVDNSWIRLTTPDGVKYGGGCRVKSITINDEWDTMTDDPNDPDDTPEVASEYGVVYEYTMKNEFNDMGDPISSGVAQYEPLIGGDEIALRCAKPFVQDIPVMTDNQLFFQYPINESYYPGPQVGYRMVTVKSLASDKVEKEQLSGLTSTTGVTEYQFYTAKEYPVITDATEITKEPFNLYIPLPFVGQISQTDITATQGYSIILNDMHGKLKSVKYYGRNTSGDKLDVPVSSVEYVYQDKPAVMEDGTEASELVNRVTVLKKEYIDSNGKMVSDSTGAIIGEEYEFFTDQRQNRNQAMNGGIDFNIEVFPGILGPFPWPTFSYSSQTVRLAVTNKIIHRSGVLAKTIATDGQSIVTTENKLFDEQTGVPLLTTVKNDFDKPIYNYSIPAYWSYEGMGAAYQNYGFYFFTKAATYDGTKDVFTIDSTYIQKTHLIGGETISYSDLLNILHEGDEFVVQDYSNLSNKWKATVINKSAGCSGPRLLTFHTTSSTALALNSTQYSFTLVRSGRRNQITVNSGNIVALNNPVANSLRGTLALSTVSYNGTDVTLRTELAAFLNSILCSGDLPLDVYTLSDSRFYQDGEHLLPTLSSLFTHLEIGTCDDVTDCADCTGGGYHLTYTMKTGSTCTTGTCHCIARSDLDITSFTAGGDFNELTVNYIDPETRVTSTGTTCIDCFDFQFAPQVTWMTNVLNASAVEFRDYWDYDAGYSCVLPGQINLYAIGKKGIWRPWRDHYYRDDRFQTSTGVKLSGDGVYDGDGTDKKFYFFNWRPTVEYPRPAEWTLNNVITKYNSDGYEVENKDILGLYSGALYGYNGSLNTAVGANARQAEIFFDPADDPSCVSRNTTWTSGNALSTTIAHTGEQSIMITSSSNSMSPSLSLTAGKKYMLGFWVARTGTPVHTYVDGGAGTPGIKIKYYNGNSLLSTSSLFQPSGKVIEKWQRAEVEFTPPANTTRIELVLEPGTGYTTYFDDIRIFPHAGNMKSFVYDEITFRLIAALDENNYAAIYSYDEAGNLFLVKKETVNGVKTIQESRGFNVEKAP